MFKPNPGQIKNAGAVASRGFIFYLKMTMMIFFFSYLLIHITALAIQERDFGVVIRDLGKELFSPLQTAQEKINGLNNDNFFQSIWSYWGIFYEFYKIFLWFKIYMWITGLFSIDSPAIRILGGIFIFYFLNILYTTVFLGDFNLPFKATKDIFTGLIKLFANPQFNFSFKFLSTNSSCTDSICTA
jgi:hypothetical protein